MQRVGSIAVPCNGCTACCENDTIVLHPEDGDNVADYLTVPGINPLTGAPCRTLAKAADGRCIYLGKGGCTIHGRAPMICRKFDCRRFFTAFSRAKRRELVRDGLFDKRVLDAGRARLEATA